MSRCDLIKKEITANVDDLILSQYISIGMEKERASKIAYYFHDIVVKTSLSFFMGQTYWFDGKIYVPVDSKELKVAVFDSMRESGVPVQDLTMQGGKMYSVIERGFIRNLLFVKKDLICFQNCILDLNTGETFEHSRDHHVVNILDYNYDKTAKCDLWHKFLEKVLPDETSRMVLQEYLGLIFADRSKVKIEKMLFLFGTGSNGKSVVFETVTGLLGKENVSHFEIRDLTSSGTAQYNVSAIDGKLLNYCSEIDKAELQGSSTKGLISGEPQSARMPYREPWVARNIPLMIANANELPATSDHTKGYYRRMLIIPFDVEIKKHEADLELSTKLRKEFAGVLNWIFEGRQRMIDNNYKFTDSMVIDQKLNEYETESNSTLLFMKDKRYFHSPIYKDQKSYSKSAGDLFKEYKTWCLDNGLKSFSNKAFSLKIKEKNFICERGRGGMMYVLYDMPFPSDFNKVETDISRSAFYNICNYKCGFASLIEIISILENTQPTATIEQDVDDFEEVAEVEELDINKNLELPFDESDIKDCPF